MWTITAGQTGMKQRKDCVFTSYLQDDTKEEISQVQFSIGRLKTSFQGS